jgi:hypothetical protein
VSDAFYILPLFFKVTQMKRIKERRVLRLATNLTVEKKKRFEFWIIKLFLRNGGKLFASFRYEKSKAS